MSAAGAPALHDVGYRRYDGARLGRPAVWGAIAADGFRGCLGLGRNGWSKVWPWLLIAFTTLPTIIVIIVASVTSADSLSVTPTGYVAQILPVLTVLVAVCAPRLVSRDLRHRVLPLYLARPVSRREYASARAAALVATTLIATAAPVLVLTLGALLLEFPWWQTLRQGGTGLLAALLAAVLYSAVALAIAVWTPRRGLATAAVAAWFLVSSGIAAIVTELLLEAQRGEEAVYAYALSPFTLLVGLFARMGGAVGDDAPLQPTWAQTSVLALAWAVSVLVAGGVMALRYRRVSAA